MNYIFTAAFVKPVLYPSLDSWDAESSGECFYFILFYIFNIFYFEDYVSA